MDRNYLRSCIIYILLNFSVLQDRQLGPRIKYVDSRTAILHRADSTVELKITHLKMEDAGRYACQTHLNSKEARGAQIWLDVLIDQGNGSHCRSDDFR